MNAFLFAHPLVKASQGSRVLLEAIVLEILIDIRALRDHGCQDEDLRRSLCPRRERFCDFDELAQAPRDLGGVRVKLDLEIVRAKHEDDEVQRQMRIDAGGKIDTAIPALA